MSGSWLDQLLQASWRGIPFFVRRSEVVAGRKTADHQYPFRDVVWIEDLGKRGRIFSFDGILVGDDCYAQEKKMHDAANAPGTGTLVHPSFGSVTAAIVDFASSQDYTRGRTVSLSFKFAESVASPVTPTTSVSTQSATQTSATTMDDQSMIDFVADLNGAVTLGPPVTDTISYLVGVFGDAAETAVSDAGLIWGAVAQIIPPAGFTFGRYAAGALLGLNPAIATTEDAIISVTDDIAAVAAAVTTLGAAGADAGKSAPLAAAVQAVIAAVQAAAVDPADQVRLLSDLAAFDPPVNASGAPIGAAQATAAAATTAVCRRAALSALGRASAAYNPASSNEAIALRDQLCALYDAEILIAGDAEDVNSYQALRALRTSVVLDLNTRAAALPGLVTVTTNGPEPALLTAYRLYADATRCDELIGEADPINPIFMPTQYQALSA